MKDFRRGMTLAENEGSKTRLLGAMRDFRFALESGLDPHPWDVWSGTLHALAAGDRGLVHELVTLPLPPEPAWLVAQVRALTALFRGDDRGARFALEESRALLFNEARPSCLEEEIETHRMTHRTLLAIFEKDAMAFRACLGRRSDFPALGMRALAEERGLR